ncbi:MAG: hypothetical protein Q4B54_08190 [Coriobacteriales bacterium]|nr:hypothetical protein [Coriobacteriales bacterium]
MAVLIAAMIVVPGRAIATVIDYNPTNTVNPVADNITRLKVNKLEKGARDYVVGAHLAIIEKETGKVITEWTTDGSEHEVSRNAGEADGALNVDTVYILRELEVPAGYKKAADVEFVIHSDNFNTSGEIISGDENGNADSEAIKGSGPVQAYVINLYDEHTVEVEDTVTKTNKVDKVVEREEHISGSQSGHTQKTTQNYVWDSTSSEVSRYKENSTSGVVTHTNVVTRSDNTNTTTNNSETNSASNSNNRTTTENLTKTGDEQSNLPVVVLAIVGMGLVILAIRSRRKT